MTTQLVGRTTTRVFSDTTQFSRFAQSSDVAQRLQGMLSTPYIYLEDEPVRGLPDLFPFPTLQAVPLPRSSL